MGQRSWHMHRIATRVSSILVIPPATTQTENLPCFLLQHLLQVLLLEHQTAKIKEIKKKLSRTNNKYLEKGTY